MVDGAIADKGGDRSLRRVVVVVHVGGRSGESRCRGRGDAGRRANVGVEDEEGGIVFGGRART